MLLPIKSKNPPESFPFVTCALLFLNVVIFFATSELGLIIREDVLMKWAFKSEDFPSVTLLTSMFLHADIFHLLGNMWFLYLFGFAVEGRLRTWKFVLLYFVSGFCGDLLHHLFVGANFPDVPSLGASGAIMGLVGAAIYMFPHAKINMFYWIGWLWYGVAQWSMWVVGLFYLGFDVLYAMLGVESGVANLAHIGGAVGGVLVAVLVRAKRDDSHTSEAKASLSDMGNLYALPPYEVQQIAKADPNNAEAALAWMWSHLHSGKAPPEECFALFERHLPRLVRTTHVRELAAVLAEYGGRTGRFHPRYLVDVGLRAEREAEPQAAVRLLESALANPHISGGDKEAAMYQLAMVHEAWFKNYGAAANLYQQVINEFGGSPLADQAAARFKIVSPMAQQSGSYKY
jgi:membrane associated rhomboid family serine protease